MNSSALSKIKRGDVWSERARRWFERSQTRRDRRRAWRRLGRAAGLLAAAVLGVLVAILLGFGVVHAAWWFGHVLGVQG